MTRLAATAALLLVLALSCDVAAEDAVPPPDPDIGDRIYQAEAFDGKLWLLGHGAKRTPDSSLVTFDLATSTRRLVASGDAVALRHSGSGLWVLRSRDDAIGHFVIEQWQDGRLAYLAGFTLGGGDYPRTLTEVGGDPAVVTYLSVRIYSRAAHSWRTIKLATPLGWGHVIAAAPRDGSALYIGLNKGEWGGDLFRVGLDAVAAQTNVCADPSNGDCEPLTGVVADLAHPDCVVATIGLVHFLSGGRIVRICGGKITTWLQNVTHQQINGHDVMESEAFFDLTASHDALWAVSDDGLYRLTADGAVQKIALPDLKPLGGVWLTRDIPGVVILRTDMNAAQSLSGYTPMVVSLE